MVKIQNKILYKSLACISLVLTAFVPVFASAAVMSSENYRMGTNAVGSGVSGALQTQSSANYTIEYPWQSTTTAASQGGSDAAAAASESTSEGGGGGILGQVSKSIPSHINAFNTPLVVAEEQSGTLTYNLPDDKSIVIDVPKKIVPKEITIVINTERLSDANEYLVPESSNLIGKVFWNITAIDSDGNIVRQFDKYITITLQIPDSLMGAKNLGVYFLDEDTSKWVLIPDTVFTETTATFKVNHLTKFAIFGRKEGSNDTNISTTQDVLQEIPDILEMPFSAEKIEVREVDVIKPERPERIERLFDNNPEADNAQVADTKEEDPVSPWKSWVFFLVLIIIVWYLAHSRKKKVSM